MGNTLLKIQAPNEFAGNQIIIASDRLIFNAATSDLILASKNTIALSAENELHINSAGDMYLNVKQGSKITIGKPGTDSRSSDQPAVLGNNQIDLLDDILELLMTFQVLTPNGEGQAGPEVAAKIQKIKSKYFKESSTSYILSDLLFIVDNHK